MLNPDQTRWRNAVLMATVLAGCTPLEWHRAGMTPEDLSRDQARCTAQARSEAALQRAPIRAPSQMVTDPQGRVVAVRPASPDSERFALEQDLMRHCMQDLGYSLQTQTQSP
jgi:hypothetical protein